VHLLRGVFDVHVDEEQVCLAVDVFDGNLEAVEASGVTSVVKLLLKFLLTMPSEAAKKARTCRMKCCSVVETLFQSVASAARSISSAVEKEALAFLYILQMLLCWMGNRTKRWGFACRSGSAASLPVALAMRRFNGFLQGRRAGGIVAEFFPVIAVITNEVGDLPEGLVHDNVFERHDLTMVN
jgi:hypothetical protein